MIPYGQHRPQDPASRAAFALAREAEAVRDRLTRIESVLAAVSHVVWELAKRYPPPQDPEWRGSDRW